VIDAVSHLVERSESARSNYALLDFAATICRARDPDHRNCPLAMHCIYYKHLPKDRTKNVQGHSFEQSSGPDIFQSENTIKIEENS
jgi:adenine-specific DNA glycosylase